MRPHRRHRLNAQLFTEQVQGAITGRHVIELCEHGTVQDRLRRVWLPQQQCQSLTGGAVAVQCYYGAWMLTPECLNRAGCSASGIAGCQYLLES